jgi:hypothetical protein
MPICQKLCRLLPLRHRQGARRSRRGLPAPLPTAELFRPEQKTAQQNHGRLQDC